MSSRPAHPERRRRLLLLAGAAVAAVAIVVVAIVISQGGAEDESTPAGGGRPLAGQEEEVRRLFDGIPQRGASLGRRDAPATLIEFADLQCPFCAQYAVDTLPSVVRDYVRGGRLRLELRLLSFIGEDSVRAARLAYAAALQNRMWQFSDLFFRNQGTENSGYATDAFLRRLADATPGLDAAQAFADRDGNATERSMRRAEASATALGVDGTPTFYVRRGDRPLQPVELTALDPGTFTAALESALGGG